MKYCSFTHTIWRGRNGRCNDSGVEVYFERSRSVFFLGPKCLFTRGRNALTRGRSVFSKKGRSVQSGPKWKGPKWQAPKCPKFDNYTIRFSFIMHPISSVPQMQFLYTEIFLSHLTISSLFFLSSWRWSWAVRWFKRECRIIIILA